MSQYGLIFLAGIAASWHCIGMCGGFACALSGCRRGADAAMRQLLYNAGRITTYCFLGVLAGALTASICKASPDAAPVETVQRVLAVASGLVIVLIGVQSFGLMSGLRYAPAIGFGGEMLAKGLRDLQRSNSPAAPLAFGAINGLLPCPLVYGMLAQAAAGADAATGLAVMAAFGLGTLPAMLLTAGFGGWLREKLARQAIWRRRAALATGLFFVALGIITAARGLLDLHNVWHLS
jgi:uncharacterized protein